MKTAPFVRPYRASDREALAHICVMTAHQGQDSSALYPDPALMPSIFAHPYAHLEPDFAFVLDDGTGNAVGYVLGVPDTPAFAGRYRKEWLPEVADRYPAPDGPARTPSDEMIGLLHTPERMVRDELAAFPAHLHIDLLPPWQGQGHGRTLMRTLLQALERHGVPAVHLCMVQANTPARAFYDRLGFWELAVDDPAPVWYLGRSTAVEW
ncbi:GNAT family N-acetyltransferase [Streptomyces sp. VRA16 Mangrove soil]|uniref:GNAT family N-acetyltransferase n=1 Tax=Streptomyces sp. VRA16 Mangrove soil TaxID=2817434 RepID=UPI001A9F059B|nr:GNAT family N-acetyltransferase [Streptomyces sp. VRA16 Mangrove soil]MBO1332830.1 GNAT family N-acetyltransferase [Streptomyces sp. VRA16 Mangrove soil]